MSKFLVVGCYSHPPRADEAQENSMFIVKLDLNSGNLKIVSKYSEVHNISFFSLANDQLFAVTEDEHSILHRFKIRNFEARSTETSEKEKTPVLELEHSLKFEIKGACFVSTQKVDDNGTTIVAVACYDDGAVKFFKSDENGLKEISKKHELKLTHCANPNSNRQEAPHAHCLIPWKGKTDVFALVDLGADRIYQLKVAADSLSIIEENIFEAPVHSGPRHLIFHQTRPLAFLITELSNELFILSTKNNKLSIIQKLPLVGYPENIVNAPNCKIQNAAHISLSSDGRYILCSNRGKINDIIVFKLDDDEKANVQFLQAAQTGEFPRYFEIVDDRYIIVANQKSHTLVVYSFNKGQINTSSISEISLQNPVAICQLSD